MSKKSTSPPKPSAHFIGIGGIGISALARWFLAQGWLVSGSDLSNSSILTNLRKAGAMITIGHKRTNLPHRGLNMVIYSSAVPKSNPELVEARRRGMKPLSYPEVVGCLTEVYKTIAIAGSHGKSTTTALTSSILISAGVDPSVILGTNLKELANTNFRKGKSGWLVLEADEWNASFLKYHPDIAIVTNVDKEHLDFYKSLANVKKTFLKFLARTKLGGTLILNGEDDNLKSLQSPIERIAQERKLKVIWYKADSKLRYLLKIPGAHNVSNASAALEVGRVFRIKRGVALKALNSFTGSWRRMEYKGLLRAKNGNSKIKVYDDYAHHPTEIKATLSALRERFPDHPIICVYQPHQAKRLQALFKEFVSAFSEADYLILLSVYEVAGRDKVNSSFTSEKLVKAILKKYSSKRVYYLADPKNLKKFLSRELSTHHYPLSPVLVMMGAGDIVNLTPSLVS